MVNRDCQSFRWCRKVFLFQWTRKIMRMILSIHSSWDIFLHHKFFIVYRRIACMNNFWRLFILIWKRDLIEFTGEFLPFQFSMQNSLERMCSMTDVPDAPMTIVWLVSLRNKQKTWPCAYHLFHHALQLIYQTLTNHRNLKVNINTSAYRAMLRLNSLNDHHWSGNKQYKLNLEKIDQCRLK